MKNMLGVLSVALLLIPYHQAWAQFSGDERQALQQAVGDAGKSLAGSGVPRDKTISLLPIRGDRENYLEGLLKNAITSSGFTYVEGKDDPFWAEVLKEVEWDERKDDMLDQATLVKFGKLKATQLLMYGVIRDVSSEGRKVFVEIELHLTSIETKQNLWGGNFTKRFYLPGDTPVQGIVNLDAATRTVLQNAFADAVASLKQSGKFADIRTVAMGPIAGDIDGYIKGLAQTMISRTSLVPKELGCTTMAETRAILRDQPGQADAIIYGALRDLSRRESQVSPRKTTSTITAEVQLTIQSAGKDEILWSETLTGKGTDETVRPVWEWMQGNPKVLYGGIAGLVGLMIIVMFAKAATRAR